MKERVDAPGGGGGRELGGGGLVVFEGDALARVVEGEEDA